MESSPLLAKTYDFLQWLLPHTAQFPKAHRHGLARHLQEIALAFYDTLIEARLVRPNDTHLRRADQDLAKLRQYLRLSRDLGFLSFNQYEYASRLISEMGRLLGGWLKKGEISAT